MKNRHLEGSLMSAAGISLYFQSWLPATNARAHMIIAHGLGEHSGRYGHVAGFFNQQGVAVFALDHIGHGKSGGKRGHVRGFSDFCRDLEELRLLITAQHGDKPLALFGHSMGGAIAFDYALQHQQKLSALLLSAPALGVKMKIQAWQEKAANALAHLLPTVTLNNGIDAAWLSHDEAVVKAYRTDPLVHPKISVSLFSGMINAGRRCNERASDLSLPTMMIFGGLDEIVSFDVAHQAFSKIKSPDKQELVFENAKHEIHNDRDKQNEFDAIWQWLKFKMS